MSHIFKINTFLIIKIKLEKYPPNVFCCRPIVGILFLFYLITYNIAVGGYSLLSQCYNNYVRAQLITSGNLKKLQTFDICYDLKVNLS